MRRADVSVTGLHRTSGGTMMMSRCRLSAVLTVLVVSSAPRIASALPFSSSVQRFEADGNAYGSADGVFDLVDEFDDGVLAPNWAPLIGTAVESGGVLTVRDPGLTVPLVGLTQEISTVESTEELANGAGNFVVTAYWRSEEHTSELQSLRHLV